MKTFSFAALCFFFLIGKSTQHTGRCEPRWEYFGGECYRFVNESMNRKLAEFSCEQMKSQLASVRSEEENKFIHNNTMVSSLAWIGLHQNFTWEWSNKIRTDFTKYAVGYPNGLGYCIGMSLQHDYQWVDHRCDEIKLFVCEKLQNSSGLCDREWQAFNKSCYYYSSFTANWQNARDFCQKNRSSSLAWVDSQTKSDYLIDRARASKGDFYWIGLSTKPNMKWTDGNNIVYEDWQSGEPSGFGSCVEIKSSGWSNMRCRYLYKKFVCKRNVNAKGNCSSPWKGWNENCYYFSSEKLYWNEADLFCKSNYSQLTSIMSLKENEFVKDTINDTAYWIGINSWLENAKWSDGSKLNYTNFFHTTPSTGGSCVTTYVSPHNRNVTVWIDDWCDYGRFYICRKQAGSAQGKHFSKINDSDSFLPETLKIFYCQISSSTLFALFFFVSVFIYLILRFID